MWALRGLSAAAQRDGEGGGDVTRLVLRARLANPLHPLAPFISNPGCVHSKYNSQSPCPLFDGEPAPPRSTSPVSNNRRLGRLTNSRETKLLYHLVTKQSFSTVTPQQFNQCPLVVKDLPGIPTEAMNTHGVAGVPLPCAVRWPWGVSASNVRKAMQRNLSTCMMGALLCHLHHPDQ